MRSGIGLGQGPNGFGRIEDIDPNGINASSIDQSQGGLSTGPDRRYHGVILTDIFVSKMVFQMINSRAFYQWCCGRFMALFIGLVYFRSFLVIFGEFLWLIDKIYCRFYL